jgi:hypothetical protein
MTVDAKSSANPKRAQTSSTRPKASTYDMFQGLQQTRLKAAEANRKRLQTSAAPITLPVSEE